MHLKRLELYGFKSFLEKTVFEFNKGITAIVGPNGSGKSNVADAIRWALGEQSVKSLRGTRMEDVIFNGTENRRGTAFAEVTMVLCNAGGSFKSDAIDVEFGSEAAVSRRLYRSGESQYLINGVVVRLKDVFEMFMDTGLGREGYSIIGQGRIEDVLSVKSEDRRALFEEAAGIVKYRSRRDEAVSKLERERRSLERVGDIILEIEGQLEPLREQADKARRYLTLSERLKAVKINAYVNFLEGHEEQEKKADNDINGIVDALNDAEEKRGQTENETRLTREKLGKNAAEIEDGAKEQAAVMLRIQDIENEIKMQKMHIEYIEERKKRLLSDIEARKTAAAAYEEERLTGLDKLNLLTEEIINKDEEGVELRENLNEQNRVLETFEKDLDLFNARHIEILQGVTGVKSFIEGLTTSYAELEDRKEKLLEEIESLNVELGIKNNELINTESELVRLNDDIVKVNKDIGIYTDSKDRINAEFSDLKSVFKAEQAKLAENRQRYRILGDLEKSREGYHFSVKSVLEASARGQLKGVHGAVGDLIKTDARYETCLEVALGGAITDIIVDDERSAKFGIDYLKSTKSGRATFLPISAVKPRDLGHNKTKLMTEPGILGAASDFVRVDARYADIIKNILGRIVVAEKYDDAITFSRKYMYAYKIVTLAGEIINPGGSITGGSADKRFGILSRKRELDELSEAISASENLTDERNTKLDEFSIKLSGVSGLLERAKVELHEMLIKKSAKETALSGEKSSIAELQKRLADFSKQDEDLLDRLSEINKKLREQRNIQKDTESSISELLEEIARKQENLTAHKKARDTAEKRYNAVLVELSRLTEAASQTEKTANRAGDAAIAALQEVQVFENDLEGLDIEKEDKLNVIDELNIKRTETEREKDGQEEKSNLLVIQKIELESVLSVLTQAEQESYKLESRLTLELERMKLKKESIQSEAQRLHDEMWDEYNITPKQAMDSERLGLSPTRLRQEETSLRNELREMGGTVNVGAVEEYRVMTERFGFMVKQRDDIRLAEERLEEVITLLNTQMEERFKEQFAIIAENFKAVFIEMFGGGTGFLKLTDEKNALGSGIEIIARPPGKTLQNMNLLSGGERALCAIALLFAILRMKPSPFCVLDEIETALDDANVRRFARFLKNHDAHAQFILITHRKGTMEAADALYGVTMQEAGLSKLVSVKFTKEEEAS